MGKKRDRESQLAIQIIMIQEFQSFENIEALKMSGTAEESKPDSRIARPL